MKAFQSTIIQLCNASELSFRDFSTSSGTAPIARISSSCLEEHGAPPMGFFAPQFLGRHPRDAQGHFIYSLQPTALIPYNSKNYIRARLKAISRSFSLSECEFYGFQHLRRASSILDPRQVLANCVERISRTPRGS